jgi:predicted transposase/invertase (TIGR01784 family)
MGEEGDEEQLIAFLNNVLYKTGRNNIVEIKILENRLKSAKVIGDKSSVLDLRAQMADGTRVNIEVQLRDVSNMDRRSLFYWSREFSESIDAGKDYNKLPNVITINILGAEFLSLDEFHTSFHLWEDTHKDFMLSNSLEMHFIDMIKFRRLKIKDVDNNGLHRWLTFFDKTTNNKTLQKIITMDTAIKKAHEKIMSVAQNKDMLHAYHMREMAIYDFNSSINAAKRKGIAIGKEEGIAIGKEEGIAISVINLKRAGFAVEQVAGFVGLNADEVNKILEKQGLK